MSERVTSVPIERGLFVLRYVRTAAHGEPPTVFVRAAPGAERDVAVLAAPDEREGAISSPGGCVAVRAERAAHLHVTIRSTGGSAEAELRLEPLVEAVGPGRIEGPVAHLPEAVLPSLEILGHVSRRGDVRVGPGAWIAGPDAPAPIEGIEARVSGQQGLALEYQVLLAGANGSWTGWSAGGFVGTRGQARPILAVRFRLAGPGAAALRIEGEALFLGAALLAQRGSAVEFVSASGVDPLVGLKIALTAPQVAGDQSTRAVSPRSNPGGGSREGRVRVFRASGQR